MSRVSQLQAHQKLESLNRVETTINEISHEDVASVGDLASLVKKLNKIVELSVNISTDSNRCTDGLHVRFFNKKFLDLFAEKSEVTFGKNALVLNGL